MVQLKSFRYIENSESVENENEESPTANVVAGNGEENVIAITQTRSSSTTSNVSSSISGGNLTTGGDENGSVQLELLANNQESSSSSSSSNKNNLDKQQINEDELTTLSSNEEYQIANHDIIEEEDEEDGGGGGGGEADDGKEKVSAYKINGDSNYQKNQISSYNNNNKLQATTSNSLMDDYDNDELETIEIEKAVGSHTPLSPRIKKFMHSNNNNNNYGSRTLIGSPKILIHSASMGSLNLNSNNKQMVDSISEYSFVQRNLQQNNNFEIRWHNINLYACKKKPLLGYLTDNRIFKSIFGKKLNNDEFDKQQQQQQQQIPQTPRFYHSPVIMKHNKFSSPSLATKLPKNSPQLATTSLSDLTAAPQTPKLKLKSQKQQQQLRDDFISNNFNNNNATSYDWSQVDFSKQILNNVSGSVLSGQLTAILGPSGVGKTSLLNSLTGRNTLEGTGRVQLFDNSSNQTQNEYNNNNNNSKRKRMSVVTVPQEDVLPGKLTVLEDLQFTSRLKNPKKNFNHEKNINRIVQHLFMEKFLNTRIDKLSGGEARRLSIGRELLSSPDIMILDEPTSGLDANTCKKIITALRDIVVHSDNILDKPMAVIVTIHQPQQEVFNLFHRVYVMAQGGRAIYEGPPTSLLSTLLEQSSISRYCPIEQLNENPAIVAIEVASGEFGPNVIGELALHHETQMYEDYAYSVASGSDYNLNQLGGGTPFSTPKIPHNRLQKSPISVTPRFGLRNQQQQNRSNSIPNSKIDSVSLGRQTPILPAKSRILQQQQHHHQQFDHLSNYTNLSYASTYDNELPEVVGQLKVDKRLRRSVVMKSDFLSHTYTLMKRCWLLTTRDMFLMSIRILGFLLVAGGMVQIFSHALDPNENQCPLYQTEVDNYRDFMSATKVRLLNLAKQLKQASSTHLFFFHLVLCTTMVTSALAGLVFPLQMRMFIREYKNGWYSPASFITSISLAELPVDIIGPTISLLITYPLCNQPASPYYWREFGYILITIICSIICKSQAQIVGSFLMDSVENSVFISCVMVTPPALLSGIAIRVSNMSWLLQIVSYGSFLRYTFESLFVLRYGYDICPCDSDLVFGYPVRTTPEAIPEHLNRLVDGFLDLYGNKTSNSYQIVNNNTNITDLVTVTNEQFDDNNNSSLFEKFVRLVSASSNQFIPKPEQLGDCSSYRSLYLMDMGIEDRILLKWTAILILFVLASRIVTYFAVKAVIKMRKASN